ncbi:MAG TPA: phage tail sheath C-terminal domain-containing protein [Allosphingosinicella sp.]|jgi:phage tail sheath protein FI
MSYNIGLNVVEVDGTGAPAIAGAATSVAAFNILTRRGLPGIPARVTGFAEFVEKFGGHFQQGLGSYLVKGFFDNGGAVAYINRIAATGGAASTPARRTLSDGVNPTLRLEAGWRGEPDPGSWGRDLFVRTTRRSVTTGLRLAETAAATVLSAALPAQTDMAAANFPSLTVTIDGQAQPTVITFQANQFQPNPAQATRQQLADAINAGTDDLEATVVGTQIRLTSTGNIAMMSGGFTSLAVQANPTFGFAAPANAGATASALGANGATLHSVEGLKVGDALVVDDGNSPEIIKVQSVNPFNRAVTWAPGITLANFPNPLLIRMATLEFDLEVFRGGVDVDQNRIENWTGLSMENDVDNYVVARLNNPATGSKYVMGVDLASASGTGADRPATMPLPLPLDTNGADGTATSNDFIGDQAQRTGFYAFDPFDIQLLTCERTDPAIAAAGIAYCEGRDDCMYVGAIPDGSLEAGTALAYGQALQGSKRYGALYGPWVTVADPIGVGDGPTKTVPPVGHVMGTYARIERTRGVWKAPAGDEARLRNVLDVPYRLSDGEHSQLVREGAINGIRALPRAGVVIDASRTLSTDTRWLYVNVRLLFNYVKSSLRQGLRWVRQEPNKDTLWNLVNYGSVRPFLMQLWRQGAFGTGSPKNVFTIICDASNNPPSQVQLGFLNVEIYFYPSVPAETIVVKVGQQPSGETSSDS